MSYIDRAFEQVFTHIYSFVCYISSRQIYFIVKLELNKVNQNSDHGCFLWWSVFVWFMICQFSICKHNWNCIGLCCSIYCRQGFPLWCIMGYYLAAPCHQRRLNAEGSRGVYLANPRQVWHENPAMQCVVYLCRVACCRWQQAGECAQTISGGDQEPLLASSYAQESGPT